MNPTPGPGWAGEIPVWSGPQRVAHWCLAASVATCLVLYQGGPWHERLGYAALAIAAWRILRGITGPRVERFASFVRAPAATLAYARALAAGTEPRYLNHNPLGGWMVLALLACALVAGASGALYNTDRFWGNAALYLAHQCSGWALAVLAPLHVCGVMAASLAQRENLAGAMVSGRKRAPGPGDIA